MQRNNNILNHTPQRNGIALISSIFLLVFISSIVALVLGMNTQTQKQTADIYLRDQADLLAKSATEMAVLAISGHNRAGGCLNTITSVYPDPAEGNPGMFNINTTIQYIGSGFPGGCNMLLGAAAIVTPDSNGTVIIDVYVTDHPSLNLPEPVSVHRRTIQKP